MLFFYPKILITTKIIATQSKEKYKVLYSAVWEYAYRHGNAVRSGNPELIRIAKEEQNAYLQLVRDCNYNFHDTIRIPDSSEYS